MFLRSCLMMVSLVGAMSASAVDLFWVGESQPQRFDTRMLSAKGFGAAVVHDGGRLTSDANWAANVVHVVYGTLVVETNVTLTIQAGAVVQFAGGGIYSRGDCIANGVHFADAASDEVVSYVLKGNVVTDETTTFIGRNYQDDFQRHSDSSSFAFDTRGLLGKAPSGTMVHWGGRLKEDETWVAGKTHLVYGSVTVSTNVTLTVERGAVVKFAGGGIRADGSLVAEGVQFADLDDDSVGGDTRKDGWTQPHVSYAIDGDVYDDADTIYRCLDTHGEWLLDGASAASVFNTRGYGAADLAGAVTHEGAVTSDETWSASETHVVYGTLYVAAGVTLTIEPGAVVRFVGGGLVVDGRCVARGVTFTDLDDDSHGATRANAKLPEASYVLEGEIETDDTTVMMCSKGKQNDLADPGVSRVFRLETDLERVRFAGIPREVTFNTAWDESTAVEVTETRPDGSTVVLTNGTADCAGVFLWDAGETPGLYTLRHVTDTNELSASFYRLFNAKVHSGSITGDMVWEASITHVVDGSLKVMSGATLLIEPGAVVKFVEGASLTVADGGSCVAKDVTFTPLGDDTVGGDTMFDGNATVPTQDAYVVNGVEDDETTEYRYMTPPSLVTSGTVNKDTTWKGWNVYRITGDLTIASGVTLTIMPGAIVKFDDGKSLTVNSGATLNAIGTRAQPIVFTSVKDDTVGGDTNGDGDSSTPNPGDWSKISTSGGTANMAHVQILYSSKNSTTGAINMNGGTVTFVDGLIAHGLYDAIGVESGHFYMSNSVVCDCLVACRHWPRDPIVNCVFYDCGRLTQGGGQAFVNCIFSKITETWEAFGFPQNGTTYRNCCFWNEGGSVLTGEGRQDALTVCGKNGNIWGDPLFEDPDNGDFRIKVGSPCFDAGDDASAPERDHYNQPRNGQADIGIFELQYRAVKADIDLSLVSVAADASATIGGTLNVSWTVENLGSANATGSWRDTFELIDASGATIKLGSYTVSGGIVAGGKRVFTTKFNVPSAAVGAARLRVKVNAERDVFEGMIMDNNVAYAGGTIDLALAAYTPDECSTLVVGAGSSTALTIPADSGITALIIKGGAGVSAYGAYGYLPKALRNDSAAVRLEDGSLLLTLPSTDSADDFTFVIANGGYGAETVSVEPVTESLEVTEVTPNRLANTGDGYLTLRGIALDRVAQLRLVGGATFAPTAFSAASSGELSATFPLADATPGIYALEVEDADGETYRLDAAVEIYKPKMGPKLEAHLEIPTAVRQGRIYTGKIVYSNVGDTDMYAPYFAVEARDAELRMPGEEEWQTDALELLGIGMVYPKGILKAGMSHELEFEFKSGASPRFILQSDKEGDDEWRREHELLSSVATRINQRGRLVVRFSELREIGEDLAAGKDISAVCGTVVDAFSGLPMKNVQMVALDMDGIALSEDTTDEMGVFVLDRVPNRTNLLVRVVGGAIADDVPITMPSDGDKTGIVIGGVVGVQLRISVPRNDDAGDDETFEITAMSADGEERVISHVNGDETVELTVRGTGEYYVKAESLTGTILEANVKCNSVDSAVDVILDASHLPHISGIVRDTNDEPVENAVISLIDERGDAYYGLSGKDGRYKIVANVSGKCSLQAAADGYGCSACARITVESVSSATEVELVVCKYENVLELSIDGDLGERTISLQMKTGEMVEGELCDDTVVRFAGLPTGVADIYFFGDDGLVDYVEEDVLILSGNNCLVVHPNFSCVTVAGIAKNSEGEAIPSKWEFVTPLGDGVIVESDSDDRAVCELRKAMYWVKISSPGYCDQFTWIHPKEDDYVKVMLEKSGYVAYRTENGDQVVAMSFSSTGNVRTASQSTAGTWLADGFPVGTSVIGFAVGQHGGFYTTASTIRFGETNFVSKANANHPLVISCEPKDRVGSIGIEHLDGSGFVSTFPIVDGLLELTEYPSVKARVVAYSLNGDWMAEASLSESQETLELSIGGTVEIKGSIVGERGVSYSGGRVVFVAGDGTTLSIANLSADGTFLAGGVSDRMEKLWIELADGTVFSFDKATAELSNYVLRLPDDMGEAQIEYKDKDGIPLAGCVVTVGMPDGHTVTMRADSSGRVTVKSRKGNRITAKPSYKDEVQEVSVDEPKKCSKCGKHPCECRPDHPDEKKCSKCGHWPCDCEPMVEPTPPVDPKKVEPIPQEELPKLKVGDRREIVQQNWTLNPLNRNWFNYYQDEINRLREELNSIQKEPDPKYVTCIERGCTYNKRIWLRYLKKRGAASEYLYDAELELERIDRQSQIRYLQMIGGGLCIVGGIVIAPLAGAAVAGAGGSALVAGTAEVGTSAAFSIAGDYLMSGGTLNGGVLLDADEAMMRPTRNDAVDRWLKVTPYADKTKNGIRIVANGADHAVDGVRYGIQTWNFMTEMNGYLAVLHQHLEMASSFVGLTKSAANTPYKACKDTDPPRYTIETEVPAVPQSCDPNEMAGPMGVGDPETERFVRPGEWLTYTVYFENQSNATAAAQEVYVTNPLSEWLDLDSFEMGEVAFNNQVDLGLVGKQNGSCETDLAGTAYRVRTNVALDRELSTVGWYLRIVDPTTPAEWPEDPYAGFLMPNDETHCGEGHLTYRIKVREDAPRNTMITNLASIVFDYNEAIETDPFWWNIAGWPFTLGEAVNNETLEWSTGGATEWLPMWDDCSADELHDAVVTGIGNNTNSWIKTVVDGPGTVSFAWCATLASRNTKVQFLVDGAVEAMLTGSNVWESVSVTVYGEGEHELTWKMQTGRSGASADDFVALDCVGWSPTEPPTLEEALNADLVWNVDGDAEWHGVARDSLVSVREAWASVSGLGDYEYAAVETRVYGSGTLRFDWAVSCEEEYDELVLVVDGKSRKSITGEVGWKTDAVEIAGKAWHTVRWEYVKDDLDEPELVGNNRAMLDNVAWDSDDELWLPTIVGDEGATVTGDAETGFVAKPSEGKTAVEVTIPHGVEAAKVTVEVSPKVASVKPNGAKVKIVSGSADITEFLNVPVADGNGVVDLAKATVREEIVKEMLDPKNGAEIRLNAADPKLKTAPTRAGLFYQFREGETLEGMKDGDSKVGDGQSWSPKITVKGGNSAFYSIGVGKGE